MAKSAGTRQGIPADPVRAPQSGPHPPGHARPVGMPRDATMAAEHGWWPMSAEEDCELDVCTLEVALRDLRVFCTRLSACSRLRTMSEQTPQAFARAALVHSAVSFLHQAWLVLSDTGIGITMHAGQRPLATPVQQAARDCVAQWQPAAAVDQQTLELLADSTGALASAVGALACHAAEPLGAVHACIRAAANQLRAAWESAAPAWPGSER
jgi:hypothetical protein